MDKHYGVFTKNGDERTAATPEDEAKLRWTGWAQKSPATAKPGDPVPASAAPGDVAGDSGAKPKAK